MRILLSCLVTLAILVSFAGAQAQVEAKAQQQEPFSLVKALPARTILMMGIPELTAVKKAFQQSSLYLLSQDEEMQRFIAPFKKMLEPYLQQGFERFQEQIGMTVEQVLAIPSGEVGMALVDIDMRDRQMPAAFIVSVQVGEHLAKAMQIWKLFQEKTRTKFSEYQHEGITVFHADPHITYAIIGDTLLFASKKYLLEEIIASYKHQNKEPLLKDSPDIQTIEKLLFPKDEVCAFGLYVNVEQIFARYSEMMPPPAMPILETLGIKDIKALALTSNLVGRDMNTSLLLYAPGKKRGLHKLYDMEKIDVMGWSTKFPAKTCSLSIGRLEIKKLLATVEEIIQLIDPEQQMQLLQKYQQILGMVEEKLGLSLKEDLAEAFGPQVAQASIFPQAGGLFPEGVTVFTVKDRKKAEKCLDSFTKVVGLENKTFVHKGVQINYWLSPLGKLGENPFKDMGRSRNPMQAISQAFSYGFSGPAFAFSKDELYLANSPHAMIQYIEWRREGKDSLATNNDFVAASCNSQQAFQLIYINLRPMLNKWWNTLRVLLRAFEGYIRAAGVPIETALMPRAETLAKYFGPSVITLTANEHGLLFRSRGTIDAALIGVGAVGVGAAVAIPAIIKMKEKAKSAQARSKMMSISRALALYRMDHSKLPPLGDALLPELVAKELISDQMLKHSSYQCTTIPWDWDWRNFSIHIRKFPIVWQKYDSKKDFRTNVLFADGHVEMTSTYRLEYMLKTIKSEYERYQQQKK